MATDERPDAGEGPAPADEQLVASVLELAEGDPDLPEEAKLLVLAALESDEWLTEALGGHVPAGLRREPSRPAEAAREPVGAFLKSIRVKGFRGVGPEAHLALHPAPGLTVVAGRNGSGKSTFAEALELALTGDSYRWRTKRSVVWKQHWRNIHDGDIPAIRIEIAEEGAGLTTIGVDWANDAELADHTTWVQRKGQRREPGLSTLGWGSAIELFRPILSYDELGGLLEGEPSKLYDALAAILGLERITDATNRLAAVVKQLQEPQATAKALASELRTALAASTDERAARALTLLAKRAPDLDALEELATGTAVRPSGDLIRLRALAQLRVPERAEVEQLVAALREAVEEVTRVGTVPVDRLERHTALLREALDFHRRHGDGTCPVCGVGTLDEQWRTRVAATLEGEDERLRRLRQARRLLTDLALAVRRLIESVPEITAPEHLGLTALAAARAAWSRWSQPPQDDAALADHLDATWAELERTLTELRAEATAVLAEREDVWAPLATRLATWVQVARRARDQESQVKQAKRALDWLKGNAAALRNQRLAPLAEEARRIWAALRQESNVDLGAVTLVGQGNRRSVGLRAEVDGAEAGALGVMSQGELHALALALFLPRATLPDSPFRFLVLDDPIQAMDPAKVDGFVRVLSRFAQDRQVVVLSHDDRLPEAVRRMNVNARILEVYREPSSRVRIDNAFDPARRYLKDAFAIAGDGLSDEVKARVIPNLCRLAVEAAARDVFLARRLSSGQDRTSVEEAWMDTHRTAQRVALAVYDDKDADLNRWLGARPWRRPALRICTKDVHEGLTRDPLVAVEDVKKMVDDLRAGA